MYKTFSIKMFIIHIYLKDIYILFINKMITRSKKITIIPRVFTKSVVSLQYAKIKDSDNDIMTIIQEAEEHLQKGHQCVIISLVIPDSYYKNTTKSNKIHQAHTFAVSRNDKYLIVYDISHKQSYNSKDRGWDNYRFVIRSLQKNRSLRFFPLTYAKKNNFKSTRPNFNHEGPCFIYIQELEKHNAFTSPFVSVS